MVMKLIKSLSEVFLQTTRLVGDWINIAIDEYIIIVAGNRTMYVKSFCKKTH